MSDLKPVAAPPCIVCGRKLAKRTETIRFSPPIAPQPAYRAGGQFGYEVEARPGKPAGTREGNVFYLERLPRTKEEARRFVNGTIVSVRRDSRHDGICEIGVWDGETYRDKFFCTKECAIRQGYAAAQHGHRFIWKPRG